MPFDGTQIDQALSKMDLVIDLLAKPEQWCKGARSTYDGRRCIMGALQAVKAQRLLKPVVLRAISEISGRQQMIEAFNDSRSTDHALVLMVLHRAREHVAAGRFVMVPEDHEIPSAWTRLSSWLLDRSK